MTHLTYSKKDAIRIVTMAAKDYAHLLENQNFLFLYKNRNTHNIAFFQTLFTARNLQHLTGIYLINKEGVLVKNHIQFYRKCIQNRLSESEIRFKPDGTTPLKLAALPQIINFINCSKMVAIYHEIRPKLAVDLLTGTTNFCLGFTGDKRGYYMPSSALLEDIRKLSPESHQILAILSKPASGKTPCYQNIRYLAKGVRLEKLLLPPELYSILDLSPELTSQTGSPPGTQPLTPPRPEQSETPSFSP